jgi:bifunctional UDP-N-acetylglucosamine pyrophosphorylase / glucosamine-1-phosphate N-acetyltransferase
VNVAAVVLAAGEGKRMHTQRAKVLHEAGGKALLRHVLEALRPLQPEPLAVVVGHLREQVVEFLAEDEVEIVVQDPPRGTGDAVARALERLPERGELLVLSGDVPLVRSETLRSLLSAHKGELAAATLATAVLASPAAYGRIVRDARGELAAIVEARDATAEQLALSEVNAGTYVFDLAAVRPVLAGLRPENDQGEYYLTDAVGALVGDGARVATVPLAEPEEMSGVNTRAELAAVHRLLNLRVLGQLQEAGVTVLDPASTWVDVGCSVGRDSILEAGVHLRQDCVLGEGCRVGAHAVLDGVKLPDGTVVPPLAHLR